MPTDNELLRDYSRHRSESAFTELVRRHVNMVYSAALRETQGDTSVAEDITQAVFTEVARKASRLCRHPALAGWLYTCVRQMSANVRRSEDRRQRREMEAHTMKELLSPDSTESDWRQMQPVLDDAMHELSEADRAVVVLRFFEERSHTEVGLALGLTETAARKRVDRALEKLRTVLGKRGITSTASGLTAALAFGAAITAPANLAASVAAGAVIATASTAATSFTLFNLVTMTKLQAGIVGAVLVACVTAPLLIHNRSQIGSLRQQVAQLTEVSAENERLSQQVAQTKPAPRLPAPRMRFPVPAEPASEESRPTNLIAGILRGSQAPKLTGVQVASYLQENRRSAASLLAAYRTTGDQVLLQEAMQKFPNDPQVAFEAACQKDAAPEARRQWLDVLKQSAPQNSLADYLSAAEHFKAGRTDQAVQDLIAAHSKPQFQDYTLERVQDDEEAYLAAGYSVAEAKTIPSMQLLLPQLAQMKELSQNLTELAKSYRQAGDESSAQTVLQMAANLGQRYSNLTPGEPEVSQLVGIAIERIALNAMDANAPYGSAGQTVKTRLEQLTQQRTDLQQLAKQTEALMPNLTDQDWISYKDCWRNFGEAEAGRWLVNKYGQK